MHKLIGLAALIAVGASCKPNPSVRDHVEQDVVIASSQGDDTLEKVDLLLNWFPEAEHGGYFAALERGYYREVGLDVTIHSGGPNSHMIQEVALGRAAFGIANADNILFARAQDAPVIALAAPLQTSPRCLIVHEKSGIKNFDELQNVTLAVTPGASFLPYLRAKAALTGVNIVPYSGTVQQFLLNPKYVQQGYVFSEPFLIRENGGDPRVLMLSDLGFNPYTSLLFTTDKFVQNHPDLVRRMVGASMRGWKDYLREPQPTNERIHKANSLMELKALTFGAKEISPLVLTKESRSLGLGIMTPERWQTLERQLVETDQLTVDTVDTTRAFTTEFLPTDQEPNHTSNNK